MLRASLSAKEEKEIMLSVQNSSNELAKGVDSLRKDLHNLGFPGRGGRVVNGSRL